jgi:uncharacterized SAM-dependent methyltransferase
MIFMLYFKHDELANKYHVSLRTIHNWMNEAKSGKLNLTLHSINNKQYVANTAKNITLLSNLVESRRKFRNTKAVKSITPRPEFYKVYNEKQIYDIATNLEIHHEIPRQYNYLNGGASHWDQYAVRLAGENEPNIVNGTIKLLRIGQNYLDELLSKYKKVNVIDIGVGNAYPTRGLLDHLLTQKKMGRYIALDISPDILKIAERNIYNWFDDRISFEGYECDINYDRFSDLLIQEYVKENAKDTINLVLLLGGTLANMRTPDGAYKVIHDSMGINDFLIYTKKLDTQATRQYFDFSVNPGVARLAEIHRLVVDLLNIEESYYDVELGYDPDLKQRIERLRLKVSLAIKLKFKEGEREIELTKGSSILTWRAHQQSANDVHEQFERNDFYILNSMQTDDCEYILTVAKVKID